ncbi:peptidoglycan DD-metalloendopeptidase family protein [Metabacillus indicus]|uniref:Peptidase M23 n=1 Tax=Metabacillus indicus TaxID=246786 RepID=A0A084GNH9_METID|nr:M23 family metallopeptidase [Metabacillus indicus]KEZ48891.1 peptidase M23 [Metabacillus indicus]
MFKRITGFVGNNVKHTNSTIKKALFGLTFAGAMTFGMNASAEENLETVYHIYLDGERIGTVDSQQLIDDLSKQKIEEAKKEYKDYQLTVEEMEVIPEQMFRPAASNEETLAKLKEELNVAADAALLKIDNQTVGYFKNKEEAERVLKAYKAKYVPAEQVEQAEKMKQSSQPLQPLKENESRIVDVSFSGKVSISEGKISPEEVLTAQEGVKLLAKGTLEEKKHKVKETDVLSRVASEYKLSVEELLALNPGLSDENVIKPGEELNVKDYKPFTNVLVKEEVSKKEAIAYETEVVEDSSMFKGDKKTKQEGKDGQKLMNYVVHKENGKEVKRETTKEETLTEPVKEIIVKGTKVVPSRGNGSLQWPAVGGYVSSKLGTRWGKMHKGIDIARPSDRTIKAADNGKIISAGNSGAYGNKIEIDHGNGMKTVYAHLDSISVSVGDTVSQGQKIGVMGSTGRSTGVHLHFEVYENGKLKDPLKYLKR